MTPSATGTRRGSRRKKGEAVCQTQRYVSRIRQSGPRIILTGTNWLARGAANEDQVVLNNGNDRRLRFLLSRNTFGDRPTRIFYYKQHLGLKDASNRIQKIVKQTASMAHFSAQPGRGLVRDGRAQRFPGPRTSVVPLEDRTRVRRHADDCTPKNPGR